jgi:hypothetical protein
MRLLRRFHDADTVMVGKLLVVREPGQFDPGDAE